MFNAEKMKGNSIRDKVRHLFGYNLRVRHLEYDTDEKGDGFVRFVPSKQLITTTGEKKHILRMVEMSEIISSLFEFAEIFKPDVSKKIAIFFLYLKLTKIKRAKRNL